MKSHTKDAANSSAIDRIVKGAEFISREYIVVRKQSRQPLRWKVALGWKRKY
jgi:hypothetical protein